MTPTERRAIRILELEAEVARLAALLAAQAQVVHLCSACAWRNAMKEK